LVFRAATSPSQKSMKCLIGFCPSLLSLDNKPRYAMLETELTEAGEAGVESSAV
jgi:hypothetical protein